MMGLLGDDVCGDSGEMMQSKIVRQLLGALKKWDLASCGAVAQGDEDGGEGQGEPWGGGFGDGVGWIGVYGGGLGVWVVTGRRSTTGGQEQRCHDGQQPARSPKGAVHLLASGGERRRTACAARALWRVVVVDRALHVLGGCLCGGCCGGCAWLGGIARGVERAFESLSDWQSKKIRPTSQPISVFFSHLFPRLIHKVAQSIESQGIWGIDSQVGNGAWRLGKAQEKFRIFHPSP